MLGRLSMAAPKYEELGMCCQKQLIFSLGFVDGEYLDPLIVLMHLCYRLHLTVEHQVTSAHHPSHMSDQKCDK